MNLITFVYLRPLVMLIDTSRSIFNIHFISRIVRDTVDDPIPEATLDILNVRCIAPMHEPSVYSPSLKSVDSSMVRRGIGPAVAVFEVQCDFIELQTRPLTFKPVHNQTSLKIRP